MLPAKNAPTRGGSPRTANAKLTKRAAETATIIVLLGERRSVAFRIRGSAWLPIQTRRSARPRRIASPRKSAAGGGPAGDANPTAKGNKKRARRSVPKLAVGRSGDPRPRGRAQCREPPRTPDR